MTSATCLPNQQRAATTATTLNSLADNVSAYPTPPPASTDKIVLQGTTSSGAAVNTTLTVDSTTTLGNLITAINTDFPGSTASLDSSGNLIVTANTPGPSKLSVSLSDAGGNTGKSNWSNHALQVTAQGSSGTPVNAAIQVYDTQGTAHTLSLSFLKQANGTWNMTASIPSSDGTMINNTITGIAFNPRRLVQSGQRRLPDHFLHRQRSAGAADGDAEFRLAQRF